MAVCASARRAGNLPAELTSFVGRRREAADVRRLLSTARLVTIAGVGGVGKTRLALHVAAELRRAFDAVWLVELAGLRDPALLGQTVAATVGLRSTSARDRPAELTELLAAGRTLLILDNCEHLGDACADLAADLLRGAERLRILATSRRSLRAPGEHILPLAPLPVPAEDARPSLQELAGNEAVRLFTERAAAVRQGFVVDEGNRAAVAALCRRLDGIPLAIELAAARVRGLSVQMIVENLGERYRLLAGDGTTPPRQRSLRALIDWSHLLLSEPERALWARLSVFPAHFDLDAAEAVCGDTDIIGEEVLEPLVGLVDKSLLAREEHDGHVRYRMLETIRQFADERLTDPALRRTLARRHRDWCLGLVERAAAAWFGPDQPTWFARLRLEQANLRAALRFCLDEPDEAGAGLRMVAALYQPYWLANSYVSEGRRWLDRLLRAAPAAGPQRARALTVGARLALLGGDETTAHAMLSESDALAGELGDIGCLAHIAYLRGLAALHRGDGATAIELLRDAVDRHTESGDLFGIAMSACNLAVALGEEGARDRAVELCEEHLARCRDHGESWCRLYLLTVLSVELWHRGDNGRAAGVAREALRASRVFDDRISTAIAIEALALIAETEGHHEHAARMLGAAETVARSAGAPVLRFAPHIAQHERCVARLRDALGDDTFTSAVANGRGLTVRQAVNEALGRPSGARAEPAAGDPPATGLPPLTPREREVAALVAGGLTNRQIADRLVIAQRTAEGHVERILAKLNFGSRAQIAAWVVRGDAAPRPPHET